MKKIFSGLPVLIVLAALFVGAGVETASAGKLPSLVSSPSSGSTVTIASRSGATTCSGDPDVGQNGSTAQKRDMALVGGTRNPLPIREAWTMWIWAMWNLRIAR